MRSPWISKLTLILGVVVIVTALTDQTLRAQTNNVHTTERKIDSPYARGTEKLTVEETPKYVFNANVIKELIVETGQTRYTKTLWVVRRGDKCDQSCAIKFAESDERVGPNPSVREQLWLPNQLGQVVVEHCNKTTVGAFKSSEHVYEIYKPIGEERASIENRLLEGTMVIVTNREGELSHVYQVYKKGEGWKDVDSAVDHARCNDPKYPFGFYNETEPKS